MARSVLMVTVTLMVVSWAPWSVAPAAAQTVQLTTPFPAVEVEAGGTTTLQLEVASTERQQVDLSVVAAPEGWQTTLRGGGFVISSVTAGPDEPTTVDLQVRVPEQAAGTGEIVVAADGAAGGGDELAVSLGVAESVQGAVFLDTEFPTLRGGAEDTFTFDLSLHNQTGGEITFGLAASGPEGWQTSAQPAAEQRASTITVASGSTGRIRVEATPPSEVTAGRYPITVEATGSGQQARAKLTAVVTGNLSMRLTTPSERLNATGVAGQPTEVPLVVVNDGSAPLTGVSLSASPPTDWQVEFEPARLERLPAGQSQRVTALVTPAEEAIVGDYVVTMTADSSQGRSASTDIRFSVQTATRWGIVGGMVILAAVGGLVWVFRRYGRR